VLTFHVYNIIGSGATLVEAVEAESFGSKDGLLSFWADSKQVALFQQWSFVKEIAPS
jgi:hypothetical protein